MHCNTKHSSIKITHFFDGSSVNRAIIQRGIVLICLSLQALLSADAFAQATSQEKLVTPSSANTQESNTGLPENSQATDDNKLVPDAPAKVQIKEITDLNSFIQSVTTKNLSLRTKNSQRLFAKRIQKPKTSLLPLAMYKSLGFRLRDPFVAELPETSTRQYGIENSSNLYFEQLYDLEQTWALLSSTRARIENPDAWFSDVVEQNVALDAIDIWYRMTRKEQYRQWLSDVKQKINQANEKIILNREEYAEAEYTRLNIKTLELLADNTELNQFIDTESAYLFVRNDTRTLPDAVRKRVSYRLDQAVFCQADAAPMQVGNVFLSAQHPELLKALQSGDSKEKAWQLAQVSRSISKQLLAQPTNRQLLAANYFLSDAVLSTILALNHKRLNEYGTNTEPFFIKPVAKDSYVGNTYYLEEFATFQNDIFDLMLFDSLIASERVASANLQLFRGCLKFTGEEKRFESLVYSVENRRFTELNFPQGVAVQAKFAGVKQRWSGERYTPQKAVAVPIAQVKVQTPQQAQTVSPDLKSSSQVSSKPISVAAPKPVSTTTTKPLEKTPEQTSLKAQPQALTKLSQEVVPKPAVTEIKPDSIIGASSEQAAQWLLDNGFKLSSYEEIWELTSERGYSIQVLTTSSPSEAAFVARRLSRKEEVKVYLSSVTINSVVEKRYKVLVTFFAGRVSAAKFQELQLKSEELKGYIKRYALIRNDVLR